MAGSPSREHPEAILSRQRALIAVAAGVLAAAVASLGAVVLAVIRASDAHDVGATAAVLLSLVGAILSWTGVYVPGLNARGRDRAAG